jgi:hypothetical protein
MLARALANQNTVDMLNRMADQFEQAATERGAQLFSPKMRAKNED